MTSTNQSGTPDPRQTRSTDFDPGTTAEDKPKGRLDLSLTQTLAGALAAMTAAALGSRLGVAGTIVGAAVASIIAAVASSLYTASLRHTQEKVKTVWSGRVAGNGTPTAVDVVSTAPDWDLPDAAQAPEQPAAPEATRGRFPWKGVLAGAVAAFAIAIVALTGFELLSGTAISGGQGTTIEQATKPNRPVAAEPSESSTESESPSESESESESESPSESTTPSEATTPSASDTATADPTTQQPSEGATPLEQQEPTEPETSAPQSPTATADSGEPSDPPTSQETPDAVPSG